MQRVSADDVARAVLAEVPVPTSRLTGAPG